MNAGKTMLFAEGSDGEIRALRERLERTGTSHRAFSPTAFLGSTTMRPDPFGEIHMLDDGTRLSLSFEMAWGSTMPNLALPLSAEFPGLDFVGIGYDGTRSSRIARAYKGGSQSAASRHRLAEGGLAEDHAKILRAGAEGTAALRAAAGLPPRPTA